MVAATGIPTLATPYIHANSPFKEVFQHPEIFKAHRFSFACPHYYESLINNNKYFLLDETEEHWEFATIDILVEYCVMSD